MTFSLDVDLWSIQTVPAQDAASRAADIAGRGQDFAASLFTAEPDLPGLFFPAEAALAGDATALTFAALPSPHAPPVPEMPVQLILTDAPPPEQIAAAAPLIYPVAPDIVSEADADGAMEAEPETRPDEAPGTAGTESVHTDMPAMMMAAAPADALSGAAPALAAPAAVRTDASKSQAPLLSAIAGGARHTAPQPGRPEMDKIAPLRAPEQPSGVTAAPPPAAAMDADTGADLTHPELPRQTDTAGPIAAAARTGMDTEAPAAPAPAQQATAMASAPAPAPFLQPASLPAGAVQFNPAQAVLVATTTDIPALVARASSEGGNENLIVQLDPPELGRVSIDFKFDAQGLQHVTVTAETPEAMRQLRAMHFELIQALERSGFTGQEMTFQQGASQQQSGQAPAARSAAGQLAAAPAALPLPSSDPGPHRTLNGSGRLDIKL